MIAQFIRGWLNITSPVALFQNVVLIIVQGRHLARHPSEILSEEGYDAHTQTGALMRSIQGLPNSFFIRSLKAAD